MQLIDAHCHFWRLDRGGYGWLDGAGGALEPLRRDFLPSDYPGDARLIVVQAAPTLAETDFLLDLAARDDRPGMGESQRFVGHGNADGLLAEIECGKRLSADEEFRQRFGCDNGHVRLRMFALVIAPRAILFCLRQAA